MLIKNQKNIQIVTYFLKCCKFAAPNIFTIMFKKILLILIVSSIAVAGFAQKSKLKSKKISPKNEYFQLLINGEPTPADRYCPYEEIIFSFAVLDSSILEKDLHWKWYSSFFSMIEPVAEDTVSISLQFPINDQITYPNVTKYKVSLVFEIPIDSTPLSYPLTTEINIDFVRTELDTTVCQGRDITVINAFGEPLLYENVQKNFPTPWDKIENGSASGCDSLVRWNIKMNPYITPDTYKISSCDSVIWGPLVIKRPLSEKDTIPTQERIFKNYFPTNYCCECDTLKKLDVKIFEDPKLILKFDDKAFCANDDPSGTIDLETDFTAFNWHYKEMNKDTTTFEPNLEVEYSGHYYVIAYMDTSLYEILTDLKIVNCEKSNDTIVNDCTLVIPNVITPNGDNSNEYFGIKKLNPTLENELTIYDRWGKNVFHKKNYPCVFRKSEYHNVEEAFAGISRGGQKLPDGTYYYAFKYNAIPKAKTYTGVLLIIRNR